MDDRPALDSPLQQFLDRTLFDHSYLYIDIWSLVHLASGLILGLVLIRYMRAVYSLATAIALILAYEVIELALNDILFVPETPVDTIWDVIVGFVGAFLAMRLTWKQKGQQKKHHEEPRVEV